MAEGKFMSEEKKVVPITKVEKSEFEQAVTAVFESGYKMGRQHAIKEMLDMLYKEIEAEK